MKKFNEIQDNSERQFKELRKTMNKRGAIPKRLKLKNNKKNQTNFTDEQVRDEECIRKQWKQQTKQMTDLASSKIETQKWPRRKKSEN